MQYVESNVGDNALFIQSAHALNAHTSASLVP